MGRPLTTLLSLTVYGAGIRAFHLTCSPSASLLVQDHALGVRLHDHAAYLRRHACRPGCRVVQPKFNPAISHLQLSLFIKNCVCYHKSFISSNPFTHAEPKRSYSDMSFFHAVSLSLLASIVAAQASCPSGQTTCGGTSCISEIQCNSCGYAASNTGCVALNATVCNL